jgi:hypothetical protein
MHSPTLPVLLCLATACGGSPFAIEADAAATDATAEGSAEAGQVDDVASEETSDALSDAREAGAVDVIDASTDVAACTPLAAPLPTPPGCQCEGQPVAPCTGGSIGCVWATGPTTCTAGCWSYPLAGAAGCQACAETNTCGCLHVLLVDAGLNHCTCNDSPKGPYLSGC